VQQSLGRTLNAQGERAGWTCIDGRLELQNGCATTRLRCKASVKLTARMAVPRHWSRGPMDWQYDAGQRLLA
jgi:hypothetical protein